LFRLKTKKKADQQRLHEIKAYLNTLHPRDAADEGPTLNKEQLGIQQRLKIYEKNEMRAIMLSVILLLVGITFGILRLM
jgi:hypothetical protein